MAVQIRGSFHKRLQCRAQKRCCLVARDNKIFEPLDFFAEQETFQAHLLKGQRSLQVMKSLTKTGKQNVGTVSPKDLLEFNFFVPLNCWS